MIARARTHTRTKVFRRVINRMRNETFGYRFFLHNFLFDQDMLLYYMRLKQHFFSSVFFRFSLMLTMYDFFLFAWFVWLVSKYKNSFFLFLSRFVLLILDSSSEAATRGVI